MPLTVPELIELAHAALARNQRNDAFDMYLHPDTFRAILSITQSADAVTGHTAVIYGYRTFTDASVSRDAAEFRPRPLNESRYK